MVDWSLGGVVPHVYRVLGCRLTRLTGGTRDLSEVTGHRGSQQTVTQHLQLVETSGDVHRVELTDVDPGVCGREVLDEENVDLETPGNGQLSERQITTWPPSS